MTAQTTEKHEPKALDFDQIAPIRAYYATNLGNLIIVFDIVRYFHSENDTFHQ